MPSVDSGRTQARPPHEPLAETVHLPCGVTLPNRIAKAAMSEQLADAHHRPGRTLVRLYERWGSSGAALLISGNVIVDRSGTSEPRQVVIDHGCDPSGLRDWTHAATRAGAHFWAQLNHAGGQTPRFLHRRGQGPSRLRDRRAGGALSPVAPLSQADIRLLVRKFGIAADVAVERGFTGVQVHGAHGYLINQFLSAATNTRTDDWGGSEERRRQFLLEVIDEVRARVGPSIPVALKLSSSDFRHDGVTPDAARRTLAALRSSTLDLAEISGGTFESPTMLGLGADQPCGARDAYFLDFAASAREVMPCPVMLTGGFPTASAMRRAVDAGVDLVGLARPLILNPRLPHDVLDGRTHALPRVDLDLRGPGIFRAATEIGWHTREIERRAHDQPLAPTTRSWRVGTAYLAGQVRDAVLGHVVRAWGRR